MNASPGARFGYDRLSNALLGLCLTIAPLAAMACAQAMFAREILIVMGWVEARDGVRAIPMFRSMIMVFYVVTVIPIVAYWLLTGLLSRGEFLRVRTANITLALAISIFVFAMVVGSAVRAPARLLEGACPFLGISSTYPLGFDTQSPCEVFTTQGSALLAYGLPLVLLIISALQRILSSRCR